MGRSLFSPTEIGPFREEPFCGPMSCPVTGPVSKLGCPHSALMVSVRAAMPTGPVILRARHQQEYEPPLDAPVTGLPPFTVSSGSDAPGSCRPHDGSCSMGGRGARHEAAALGGKCTVVEDSRPQIYLCVCRLVADMCLYVYLYVCIVHM